MNEDNNIFSGDEFVDISSSSKSGYDTETHIGEYAEKYGNGIFKNIGTIIKFIAFLICFSVIILSFFAAYFIFTFNALFLTIAAGVVLFGTILGIILLFIIYGIGHIICQNNEILSRLKK